MHAKAIAGEMPRAQLESLIESLTEQMHQAAADLQFEVAARIRDEIKELKRELRDMREAVVNTLGGHMTRYEALLDRTIARALDVLANRASEQGYDGVLGIRISHPTITSGAIEVVVAGTGFRYQVSGD